MKITLIECVQVWNTLTEIVSLNQEVSSKLTGGLPFLRPEIKKWNELNQSERAAFGSAEIELPLEQITKDDLPDTMPKDLYESLNPIAAESFENEKSELEKLMEEEE